MKKKLKRKAENEKKLQLFLKKLKRDRVLQHNDGN